MRRFTALAGIASVILYALGDALIADLPSIDTPARTFATYAAGHHTQLLLFVYVWGATVAFNLVFLTGLWSYLRHDARASEVFSALALGAGYIVWAIVLGGLIFVLELGYRSASLEPATAKLLSDMALLAATLSAFPTVVSVGAFSVLILRTGALARWIGWLGFVVVAAHLVAAGAFAQAGFFSPSIVSVFVAPPLFFIWVFIASLALLFARSRKAPVEQD
jgi:cbb3-type cytochrome oxidase subunit 3